MNDAHDSLPRTALPAHLCVCAFAVSVCVCVCVYMYIYIYIVWVGGWVGVYINISSRTSDNLSTRRCECVCARAYVWVCVWVSYVCFGGCVRAFVCACGCYEVELMLCLHAVSSWLHAFSSMN